MSFAWEGGGGVSCNLTNLYAVFPIDNPCHCNDNNIYTGQYQRNNNFYCVPPKLFNNIYLQLYMLYFINIFEIINKEIPFSIGIYYYPLYI